MGPPCYKDGYGRILEELIYSSLVITSDSYQYLLGFNKKNIFAAEFKNIESSEDL